MNLYGDFLSILRFAGVWEFTLFKGREFIKNVGIVASIGVMFNVGLLACNQDGAVVSSEYVGTPVAVTTVNAKSSFISLGTPVISDIPTPGVVVGSFKEFKTIYDVERIRSVTEAVIEGHILYLELAVTTKEHRKGLMDRIWLAEDAAMFFVFDEEKYQGFWMKDTLIPLDLIFLNSYGVVVDIQRMETQIGVQDRNLRIYKSVVPASYALEVNAGLADAIGIVLGGEVLFR
jgi:uncharacterized membrane protein (UPF0127 family)